MVGLISRLFGRKTSMLLTVEATLLPGNEALEVVGESRHQDALWDIVGGFRRDTVRHSCAALLLPEPDNPVDPHAIRVVIEGRHVGYLSRADAVVYLQGLRRLMVSCKTGHVALEAQIVGGGQRGDGIGFLGVFLDHNPADFGIAPHYTTGGSLRTGLSEAIATDLADDSYDLSWLTTLSDDDDTASARPRSSSWSAARTPGRFKSLALKPASSMTSTIFQPRPRSAAASGSSPHPGVGRRSR